MKTAFALTLAACWSAPPTPPVQNTPPTKTTVADAAPELAVIHAFPGIDLVASDNHAIHTHGGAPASLVQATIRLAVRDHRTHRVAITKLELLDGHCNATTWTARKLLGIGTHEIYGVGTPSRGSVTLPGDPDTYTVKVTIDNPPDVYNACDRFAYAMTIDVDGSAASVEIPLHVERESP